jgi:hypothetical protein
VVWWWVSLCPQYPASLALVGDNLAVAVDSPDAARVVFSDADRVALAVVAVVTPVASDVVGHVPAAIVVADAATVACVLAVAAHVAARLLLGKVAGLGEGV